MFPLSDNTPNHSFPIINIAIILVTSFIFLVSISAFDTDLFIYQYALIPTLVDFSNLDSLWPFITSLFLHGGFLHIISNMWFLWVFGDNVEAELGHIKYLIFYLASGTVAAFIQYLFIQGESIPMLGASGAVAGVLGAYYKLYPNHTIKTLVPIFGLPAIINLPASFMLIYWFIIQLFSGVASVAVSASDLGGVAFWAHIGGFIFGLITAGTLAKIWRF